MALLTVTYSIMYFFPNVMQVFEALGSLKFPYVYSDPESCRLHAALAKDLGIESDYILAGCGADELIDLIMRLEMEDFLFTWSLKLYWSSVCSIYLILVIPNYLICLLSHWLPDYRCVLDPGDKVVDCPPIFTMYEFDAAVNGALVLKGKIYAF